MPPPPDPRPDRELVNLRAHAVEVHLADRVVVVGPHGRLPIAGTSAQLDELERRGLVEVHPLAADEAAEGEATPAKPAKKAPRRGTGVQPSVGTSGRSGGEQATDQPRGRSRRTRGGA